MTLQSTIRSMVRGMNAIAQRITQWVGMLMYVIGLVAFLIGATVPVATVYFFLHVDITIQWWHILLGIGGNIGVFVVSMNMLRDLYVRPLIERLETAQQPEEWDRRPISRGQSG